MGKQVKRTLKGVLGLVGGVVLPAGCWARGEGEVAMGLSNGAREALGKLALRHYCRFCGLSVGPYEYHDRRNPCGRCGERTAGVDRIARVGVFSEPLVTLVHQLKFGRAWEVAEVLAPFVYQAMVRVAEETEVTVDRVVPVPLHWTRRARRGFNQAEELARAVRKLGGWEVANLLWRKRRTAEQAMTNSPTERRENMRGAFDCRAGAGPRVGGKHVWLMDDVSTTGATLCAAANALRKLKGAEKPASINAAVVCVTDREEL